MEADHQVEGQEQCDINREEGEEEEDRECDVNSGEEEQDEDRECDENSDISEGKMKQGKIDLQDCAANFSVFVACVMTSRTHLAMCSFII